jgi:hypothetical protein
VAESSPEKLAPDTGGRMQLTEIMNACRTTLDPALFAQLANACKVFGHPTLAASVPMDPETLETQPPIESVLSSLAPWQPSPEGLSASSQPLFGMPPSPVEPEVRSPGNTKLINALFNPEGVADASTRTAWHSDAASTSSAGSSVMSGTAPHIAATAPSVPLAIVPSSSATTPAQSADATAAPAPPPTASAGGDFVKGILDKQGCLRHGELATSKSHKNEYAQFVRECKTELYTVRVRY